MERKSKKQQGLVAAGGRGTEAEGRSQVVDTRVFGLQGSSFNLL